MEKFDFAKGWYFYQYRSAANRYGQIHSENAFSRIEKWNGESHKGHLLIWSEQGIGDQIIYSSMLNDLKDLQQEKTVAVEGRLVSLFSRSMPAMKFINIDSLTDLKNFDEQMAIPDLGQYYRNSLTQFEQAKYPYLEPDEDRATFLRERILSSNKGKRIIGISWHSKNIEIGESKSLSLSDFFHSSMTLIT